jgi:hypothetical protein
MNRFTFSLAILLLFKSGGISFAANPPGGRLSIESEPFWMACKIALVKVAAVDDLEPDRLRYTVEIEKVFTPDDLGKSMIIPASFLHFGRHRPTLKRGDCLFIALPRSGRSPVIAMLPSSDEEKHLFARSLEEIAAVRAEKDKGKILRQSLRSEISAVVLYSLAELSKVNFNPAEDEELMTILKAIRNKENLDSRARLAANTILDGHHSNGTPPIEEKILWLKSAIQDSKTVSGQSLVPLVVELVNTEPSREKSVAFLLGLALEAHIRTEIRSVAIGALSQEKCFDRDHPAGKISESIVSSLIVLLKDPNELIRQYAVQVLHNLAIWTTDPKEKAKLTSRVIRTLEQAEGQEKNPKLRGLIHSYILYLKDE